MFATHAEVYVLPTRNINLLIEGYNIVPAGSQIMTLRNAC